MYHLFRLAIDRSKTGANGQKVAFECPKKSRLKKRFLDIDRPAEQHQPSSSSFRIVKDSCLPASRGGTANKEVSDIVVISLSRHIPARELPLWQSVPPSGQEGLWGQREAPRLFKTRAGEVRLKFEIHRFCPLFCRFELESGSCTCSLQTSGQIT